MHQHGTRLALELVDVSGADSSERVAFHREKITMTTTEASVDTLNALLRGELAATETYQQALAKVGDEPDAAVLRQIHVEHREAANTLRKHVHEHGGKPDQRSGAWGAFAKTVEGAAKLFGNTAALK